MLPLPLRPLHVPTPPGGSGLSPPSSGVLCSHRVEDPGAGPPTMDGGLHRASEPRSEHPAFCPGLGGLAGEWGPPQIPVPLEPWNTTFFGIRTFQDGVRGLEMKGLPGTLPSRRSSELSRGPETWAPGGRGHWACGAAWTGEWSLGGWPTRGQCPPPAPGQGRGGQTLRLRAASARRLSPGEAGAASCLDILSICPWRVPTREPGTGS